MCWLKADECCCGLGRRVFFERKFDLTPAQANAVNSIVYIISAVASPFFGLLVDKLGRNILCVFLAVSTTIASHALLAFTFVNPFVGMVRFQKRCVPTSHHLHLVMLFINVLLAMLNMAL